MSFPPKGDGCLIRRLSAHSRAKSRWSYMFKVAVGIMANKAPKLSQSHVLVGIPYIALGPQGKPFLSPRQIELRLLILRKTALTGRAHSNDERGAHI